MSNVLNTYFKGVGKFKLLTKDQEVQLAKRIEKGDQNARELMINSNLRLAISIAKKYQKCGCPLEDLIQESNIGLMKAIEKFDWRRGYKFSTYASWWIKQAVTRHINTNKSTVRIPSHATAISKDIQDMINSYEEEFGTTPTIEEISETLGVTYKMAKAAIDSNKLRYLVSLDKEIDYSDGGTRTLGEIIPDENTLDIDQELDGDILKGAITSAFKTLTKREEQIIRLRFGITENIDLNEIYTMEDNNNG